MTDESAPTSPASPPLERPWPSDEAERLVEFIGLDGSFAIGANLSRAAGIIRAALAAQPTEPAPQSARGAPTQPGDAERLERLRALYAGCAETDDHQPVGIGHPVFLLRILGATQSALAASQAKVARLKADLDLHIGMHAITREHYEKLHEKLREELASLRSPVAPEPQEEKLRVDGSRWHCIWCRP